MPSERASRTERIEIVLVLGAIALLGLIAAPLPFTGDQALYASGARQLGNGAVLYKDFWDIKQPGIYLFYLVGGKIVGYSEVALHLFELGYQLVFALVLILTLRNTFRRRWIAPLVALLVVGTYYATVEPLELGQVESLIGFPLYLTLWCSLRALGGTEPVPTRIKHTRVRVRWLAASGLCGGIVLVLKLTMLPIVGGFWVLTVFELARAVPRGRRFESVFTTVTAIGAGFLVPVALTGAYLAANGQLGTARWTWFDVGPATTGIAGRPLSRLVDGLTHTGARWAIPLALAAFAVWVGAKRGFTRLQLGLLVWIALGIPVFLIQHWWIYHYALFLTPVGILAAYGIEAVADAWPPRTTTLRVGVALGALVLLAPAVARFGGNARALARHGFALKAEDRAALRADLESDYLPAEAWAFYLSAPQNRSGGAYVLGNPLDQYLSGRPQAVAVQGWSPEQYPSSVWDRLRGEIEDAKPEHLVVDAFSDRIMRSRSPETRALIAAWYRPVGRAGPDRWYRLKHDLPAAP
jgi:hypothetical protein